MTKDFKKKKDLAKWISGRKASQAEQRLLVRSVGGLLEESLGAKKTRQRRKELTGTGSRSPCKPSVAGAETIIAEITEESY